MPEEKNKIFQESQEEKEARLALLNMLEDTEAARKKAEEEQKKTLTIIDNFSDGLLVFDENKKLSLSNPQAEKFLKIKSADIIGKDLNILTTFSALRSLINTLGQDMSPVSRKELSLGENLVIEVSVVRMKEKKGNSGSLVVLHDITREKDAEKLKTEFVTLAAHQLRTPLSAIKWTIKMLLEGDIGKISDEQKEMLGKTYESNERMIDLINDLLDVARIEEGKYLFRPVLSQLESVVEFVVDSSRGEAERKEIKLEFQKPKKPLPKVMLDVEKMRLVIQNFLDNAIKYTLPKGKIKISLRADKKEIEFSIMDTGVGIPENQKTRVFSKFFRSSNVIKMETEGSGLGLFISRNIIEAHGGRVWFESKEGQGTVFYFVLPVEEEFAEFLKEF